MARKTANEMVFFRDQGLKGYEAIWTHILDAGEAFSITDLEKKTNVIRQTVSDYVRRLLKAGFIQETGVRETPGKRDNEKLYEIVKRPRIAPRISRDGKISKQGLGRYHMWQTMKMLKTFTKHELAEYATTDDVKVSVATAKEYIKFLHKAGYLKLLTPSNPGKAAVYRLIRNTGHNAPMIQRIKAVFDPNLNEVTWPRDEEQANG